MPWCISLASKPSANLLRSLLYWDVSLTAPGCYGGHVLRLPHAETAVAHGLGIPDQMPIPERPSAANNPYGRTKAAVEQMLADVGQ